MRKAKLGVDHPETLQSMNHVAISYVVLGRHAEALAMREETLTRCRAKLGVDHFDTLAARINLSSSYAHFGRHSEALALREEAVKLLKAKFGADNPETLKGLQSLALSYTALGRHSEALALRQETLKLREAKLGPNHLDTLYSMGAVADSFSRLKQHAEAERLLDVGIEGLERKKSADPGNQRLLSALGDAYTDRAHARAALGRPFEAAKDLAIATKYQAAAFKLEPEATGAHIRAFLPGANEPSKKTTANPTAGDSSDSSTKESN
ncbi:MAG: tetratricopeptide repeat protein [Gemmataceae bacterium]